MRLRYCIIGMLFLLAGTVDAWAQAELIVRLHSGAEASLRAALEGEPAAQKGTTLRPLFEQVQQVRPLFGGSQLPSPMPIRAYTLEVSSGTEMERLQAIWAAQPGVAYVQRNHTYTLDTTDRTYDDPLLDSLQHLEVIRAKEAWAITRGHADVVVGFIDTGLFFKHPDLQGQLWINPGEDLNGNGRVDPGDFNGIDDDGNGFIDDLWGYDFVDRPSVVESGDYRARDPDPSDPINGGNGHGTLIAGVLGAALGNGEGIAGVAPGSRIMPLRAFGEDGRGDDDDITAAILYAAQMGVSVLNLSFGDVYYSPLMREAIQYAVRQGVVVVASAGNVGGDDPHYPSDYPEVISVAWLNAEGTDVAARGTYGLGIELGAPGSAVLTTTLPQTDDSARWRQEQLYGRYSGSSLAAPMVAGAAALLRALDPALTPQAVRSTLTASARDAGAPGWDQRTGAGLLDVAAALQRALPARTEIIQPDHNTGAAADRIPVIGTAVDPSFDTYQLFYAVGDTAPFDWIPITEVVNRQAYGDTLAVWQVETLPEGAYTLRLAVSLRQGQTVEDRRRLYIDRSAPAVTLRLLDDGLIGGQHGVIAEVITDDLCTVDMEVEAGGRVYTATSDRRARRHGLFWQDPTGQGGEARVRLTATNGSGLETTRVATVTVPAHDTHTAWLVAEPLAIGDGYMLPQATDFDRDRLLEFTMAPFAEGTLVDSLVTYEWAGIGFDRAHAVQATLRVPTDGGTQAVGVIPRDVGDMDGNGRQELLASVANATLLLEQRTPTSYPDARVFKDDTSGALFGARLADLDQDGRSELLAHNGQQWRVLNRQGSGLREAAVLANPTSARGAQVAGNQYQQPRALVADLDQNGRMEWLVGDSDGDLILYRATGDNSYQVVWTHETDRYSAGSRFAHGDFDGDGQMEFVTYAENWKGSRNDNEHEPPLALYYRWEVRGPDTIVLVDSLPVGGSELSNFGALRAVDFDSDGRPELVVVHPPDLYVLALDETGWRILHHRGVSLPTSSAAWRSIALVDADFDGDGYPELVASGADQRLYRLVYQAAAEGRPPPQWQLAAALNDSTVQLAWRSPGADSVAVYAAGAGDPLNGLITTSADSLVLQEEEKRRYVLRAWRAGHLSPLSPVRTVRPHAPARVVDVSYPDTQTVRLVFSEPLSEQTRRTQFVLDHERSPASLLLAENGRTALLRFEGVAGRQAWLRWHGVRDVEGTPVGTTELDVRFPDPQVADLFVEQWALLGTDRVELVFSDSLDAGYAADPSNYEVTPGRIAEVTYEAEQPERVVIRTEGQPLGATGLSTTLRVLQMRSAAGRQLASEGAAFRLVAPAETLADVYVFPNPHRAAHHASRVIIAGLPAKATVRVLSLSGLMVRVLEESDGDGGIAWDLNDQAGQRVPSGVYLIRVEAPGEDPILRKAALIQ